jgi:hypothetical protein
MKLGFLEMPEEERGLFFEQAAIQRGVSPVILEKDFWASWLLGVLFKSDFAGSLVFKGGTSLSKVFGVIDRFSEDLDLSLSPAFLDLPAAGASRNQANKWLIHAEIACAVAVQNQIAPVLEAFAEEILGRRGESWFNYLTDPGAHSPVLFFRYSSTQSAGFDYLQRAVKLEFGSLADQQSVGRYAVRPWIAEVFPATFPEWTCDVVALEMERTFWEKGTILPRSTIDRSAKRLRNGSRVIMPTWQRSRSTPPRARRLISMIFAIVSCGGKASSLGAHGQTTIRQGLARFALSRRQAGFPHYGGIT